MKSASQLDNSPSFEDSCSRFWSLTKQAYQSAAEGADLGRLLQLRGEALDTLLNRGRDLTPDEAQAAISMGERVNMLTPEISSILEASMVAVKGQLRMVRRAQRVAREHLSRRDRASGAILDKDA